MDITDYKQALDHVRSLAKESRFGSAYAAIQKLQDRGYLTAELLVQRAWCIQMMEESDCAAHPESTLKSASHSLKTAHHLEPSAPQPLIEWGYFEYAINDDAGAAVPLFQEARDLAESQLREALIGLVKCCHELGDISKRDELLLRLSTLFPDDPEIDTLRQECELSVDSTGVPN